MSDALEYKYEFSRDSWFRVMKEKGHTPQLNEDGKIDMFALDAGHHNGPMCETCGDCWCEHCVEPDSIKTCSNPPIEAEYTEQRLL